MNETRFTPWHIWRVRNVSNFRPRNLTWYNVTTANYAVENAKCARCQRMSLTTMPIQTTAVTSTS